MSSVTVRGKEAEAFRLELFHGELCLVCQVRKGCLSRGNESIARLRDTTSAIRLFSTDDASWHGNGHPKIRSTDTRPVRSYAGNRSGGIIPPYQQYEQVPYGEIPKEKKALVTSEITPARRVRRQAQAPCPGLPSPLFEIGCMSSVTVEARRPIAYAGNGRIS
jgi:hypothetical protein